MGGFIIGFLVVLAIVVWLIGYIVMFVPILGGLPEVPRILEWGVNGTRASHANKYTEANALHQQPQHYPVAAVGVFMLALKAE